MTILTWMWLAVTLGWTGPTSPQALEEVIRARELAFAKTMSDRDIGGFASFLSDEAVFFGADGTLEGREVVVKAWSEFFRGPDAPFSWEPDTVVVLPSGDLAHSSGPVRGPDGTVVATFNTVWRREGDGVWRVVFDKGCPACPTGAPPPDVGAPRT